MSFKWLDWINNQKLFSIIVAHNIFGNGQENNAGQVRKSLKKKLTCIFFLSFPRQL